ncbi:TetR/AcrR family transcriptional regulator [Methanocella sp. CWC-04]|uniref:TetR/AcrR family transcriptional regulator n=1 Tax=Methanooceanicella nereidis TaxID=2052831 RepID=A0AAP2REX7_9EURY|nr:TetR/AcrR family transcriptional regulator [Methanocella sp. CWC-04]MCD1295295.1 TetR/AcrR family transcriptional regulator [Methanocella sp. CWC-04]
MSITDRKEREKEQRRNAIIDAAEKMFFSRGYDNVSMDDIARAVELNKATLYLYFKNKEALFFAVVLRGARILNSLVKENIKTCKTGYEKLWETGHAYFTFFKKYPDYNQVQNYFYSGRFDLSNVMDMQVDAIDGGKRYALHEYTVFDFPKITDVEDAKEIIMLHHEIFVIMCNSIKEGIDEGMFRPDLDPAEAAIIFTMVLESVPNMRPDLKSVLDSRGIDRSKFSKDIGDFIGNMLKIKNT